MPPLIYEPSRAFIERSYLTEYRRYVNTKHYGLNFQDYDSLHQWSVTSCNDFWMSLWNYLTEKGLLKASRQPRYAVDESIPIDQLPEFYPGSRLNYAEVMLGGRGNEIAIRCMDEENLDRPEDVSWDELREKVRKLVSALKSSDFKKGDVMCVVGGSNAISLALVLSAAAIGAIVASFVSVSCPVMLEV